MKIVCITPDDLSTLIFCRTLSRLLTKHEEVDLVTISGNVEGQSVDMYAEEVRLKIQSRHIDIPMRRFVSPLKDSLYLFRLYRTLRKEKPGIVVTFATKPNIFGQFAASLAGVPYRVMAVRGLGRTFNAPVNIKAHLMQRIMKGLYKASCRLVHKVWFTNRGDLKDFISLEFVNESKAYITKNAVDLEDFSNECIHPEHLRALRQEFGLNTENQVVIMVARLIEPKGVREFAEAAVQLRTRLPQLRFLLVAPEEPDCPAMIDKAYIWEMEDKSHLNWLGFRKDVRELYALSDMAVLPSYYKEGGYPRALLEAMAYGKPVIAADTPECRGPVEHGQNGFLVPPRDAGALARAIEKIVSTPSLSEKMGAQSLARMQNEFDDKLVFTALIRDVLLPSKNLSGSQVKGNVAATA